MCVGRAIDDCGYGLRWACDRTPIPHVLGRMQLQSTLLGAASQWTSSVLYILEPRLRGRTCMRIGVAFAVIVVA